jgi:hypothetical protein
MFRSRLASMKKVAATLKKFRFGTLWLGETLL